MKTKPLICLLFLLFALGLPMLAKASFSVEQSQESFLISVDYDNGNYTLDKVLLMKVAPPDLLAQPETGFRADAVSANDEMLYSFTFGQPNILCGDTFGAADPGNISGCHEQAKGSFTVQMPYFATAKRVNIYDTNGKMVISVDVSQFARLCGDNICQANENYGNCPNDCRSGIKDGYCDRARDGVCDTDCSAKDDPDCAKPANYLYIVLGIAALLVVGLAGYFIARKIKEAKPEPGEGQ